MTASPVIDVVAAVIAALVLAGAIAIYLLERRHAPADDDEVLQGLRPVIRRHLGIRILVLLGVIAICTGLIAFLTALGCGLAFAAGALLILLTTVMAGAGGIARRCHLALIPAQESPPWTEPSPSSLALGLILASAGFLSIWLLLYFWPEPLLLLYFVAGALGSAFIARIGGSFMVLAGNASFERVRDIASGLNRMKAPAAAEKRYASQDHGGMAAEFEVVYIAVMALAMGLGILDKGSSHGLVGSIIQISAAASLLAGMVILIFISRWAARPNRAALLNKAILGGLVWVLLSGLTTGIVLLRSAAVDVLWPVVAAFVVLFITAAILQYNTSRRYKTVRNVARHATYGPEVLFLGGNSLGMGGMLIPLLLLALLAVLADGAGSGKSAGTACMVMAAGFIASLAPLLTPYYFSDEACGSAAAFASDLPVPASGGQSPGSRPSNSQPPGSQSPFSQNGQFSPLNRPGGAVGVVSDGTAFRNDQENGSPGRRGTMVAALMGSTAFISTGLTLLAGLGLMLRLGKEGTLYAVSLFTILAYFAGVALAVAVQARLYSSVRDMLADVIDAYRRPQRELAAGRQQWNNDIYALHCEETGRYGIIHPWLPLLTAVAAMALDVVLLGAETIIPMMLAFAASGLCFLLWLDITGNAWFSAFRLVNADQYAEKDSDSYRLARGLASISLVYRQVVVPALRLLLLLALFGSLLLLISGVQ